MTRSAEFFIFSKLEMEQNYLTQIWTLVDKHMYEFLEFWTPSIMISVGVIVFILEAFFGFKAEYGRYNKKNIGLSAPIAWLVKI